MSIQGIARIELTDVHTGRTRVWEHKNRVTGAVQEIFTPLGLFTDSNMLQKQETGECALQTTYGGLLLLDTAVDSDEDVRFIPPAAGVTGTAVCGSQNSGDNRIRGSFNSVESDLDPENGVMKFVYDFDTQQGNGTIASVCLCHRTGGYLSSFDTHASNGAIQYASWECFDGYLSGTILTFLTAADLAYMLELDEASDELRLAKPAPQSGTLRLDLIAYPALTRGLDLFWPRGSTKPDEKRREAVTLQAPLLESSNGTAYFVGWNFRSEDRTLYITNAGGTSIEANGTFQVYGINIDTKQETLYTLTNQTGVALYGQGAGSLRNGVLNQDIRQARPLYGFVYDGHVYMRSNAQSGGAYRWFKIALDDAGDVTEIQTNGLQLPNVHDAYGGRIYCYAGNGYGGGYYGTVLDTGKNCILRNEVYTSRCRWFKRFDVRGRSVLQLHALDNDSHEPGLALSIRQNYLATVNDLAEPLQKTADKTMKVTYILRKTAQEDEEEA